MSAVRLVFACFLLLGLSAATAGAEAASGEWRFVTREKGVLVSTRTEQGRSHPTFRGEATVDGSVLHVLSVVLDSQNATKWVRGADQVEVLGRKDARSEQVRMITDLPWPIRDREMVMERSVKVLVPGREFDVRFACASALRPEQGSYVRVHECDSHFHIKAVDAGHTYVDYRAYLDPGGGLPNWGVRWMEKRVAVDTLSRLVRQLGRTVGKYDAAIARWAEAR
jgi:hypothetical protein